MIRVRQVKVLVEEDNRECLLESVAKKIDVKVSQIKDIKIIKKSLDARFKPSLFYIYEVDVNVLDYEKILKRNKNNGDILLSEESEYIFPSKGDIVLSRRIVIVGSGPAGLFCGYLLALLGYRPIIIERGEKIPKLETFIHITNALDSTSDEILSGVLNRGYEIRMSEYIKKIQNLSKEEQNKIFEVLDVMLKDNHQRK